jgi:uncharacterized protein YoxC
MESFSQMHIFFLISSLGFIILFILVAVFLLYVIHSVRTAKRILEKVENNIDQIGDAAKGMLEDLRDNIIFKFLFGRKKKRRKD